MQILIAHTLLRASYALPKTEIILEGVENVPRDRTVFFAMNHTDRYNYWPFQYAMWKRGMRYTATWVKGKYFESPLMARFMIATNNIPLPSRGYVISTGFRSVMNRPPGAAEYRVLRDIADGKLEAALPSPSSGAGSVVLPEGASGDVKRFVEAGGIARFEEVFARMIEEVVRLTREALHSLDLNVLVFPQGTRSIRLSKGHTGLVQMAQHLSALRVSPGIGSPFGLLGGTPPNPLPDPPATAIVPVGCNGSDRVYPGGSPWARGGRVVYRIGTPLELDGPELAKFRVTDPFKPLTPEAGRAHGEKFQAATDVVMNRINSLLDPEYRFGGDLASGGVQAMDRFL